MQVKRLPSGAMCAVMLFLAASWSPRALAVEEEGSESADNQDNYRIEGKLSPPDIKSPAWYTQVTVILDGGKRRVFLREDHSFIFQGLTSGSYLVEVEHPDYSYEPVRVDINSKGKHRARKNNIVQPNQVNQMPYPLRMKPQGKIKYFQRREEWKVTDILFNPMVMMMVLPLLIFTIFPKMMQDPETKKEMEEMQAKMNVQNQMPEVSEVLTNLLGGGSSQAKKKPAIRRERK